MKTKLWLITGLFTIALSSLGNTSGGCGGGALVGNTPDPQPSPTPVKSCQMTLSGAISEQLPCTVQAFTDSNSRETAYSIVAHTTAAGTSSDFMISAAITVTGAANTGSYDSASATRGVVTVQGTGSLSGEVWYAANANTSAKPQGSYLLELTDLEGAMQSSAGTAYTQIHGSLSAAAPVAPGSSAQGTVTIQADF